MPVVHRGSNWTINMYADDHGVPPRIVIDVRMWADGHKDLLLAKWQELNG